MLIIEKIAFPSLRAVDFPMFQNFKVLSDPAQGKAHVKLLRMELEKRNLAGFMIPRGDEHMNEYVAPYAERLAWISGFTGSAGVAFVLRRKCVIFVDGRYTLQVREQVDESVFEILEIPQNKPSDWLKKHLKDGDRLAYDPYLHTLDTVERMTSSVKSVGAKLIPVKQNLVDKVWAGQPERPLERVSLQPLKFTGENAAKKIERLRQVFHEDAVVLTLPDSIAWLFNIRGSDVAHTPLPLAYAIVKAKGKADLFIDSRKLTANVQTQLEKVATLFEPNRLGERLKKLSGCRVRLDDKSASSAVADSLKKAGAKLVAETDPCIALKAVKTNAEIEGARAAHERDGVAVCRFLCWIATQDPITSIDEITAAQKLEELRAETGLLKDISFDTISAVGANGAIVHYRVTEQSNQKFKRGTLYLVDSGGQYQDGTTDITRTVSTGSSAKGPTKEMRARFTQVLKGHIALATARFPKGTRGQDIDPLVRAPLWAAGIDFDHGTGHGVGSYLSVHEGPQRIARASDVVLEPGMILSNEPGYYKEGAFGIRIENLVLVEELRSIKDGEREMMGFETLTLAPFDRTLIDPSLLTDDELCWLNAYHGWVMKVIGPQLKGAERKWLEAATAEISI